MEDKAYGFIYITENLVNGKKYLGQRKFGNGWKVYLGSGKILRKAIKRYGRVQFMRTIIFVGLTREGLNETEKSLIKEFNCVEDSMWYNISTGGIGSITRGFAGKKHTQETKDKIRIANTGRPTTDNIRRASAENARKSSQNPEARRKHALAVSGAKHFRAKSVIIHGITYPTITAARKATNFSYKQIKAISHT